MNNDIDKFNRALNKFLRDNPDIDFDTVKDEFIEMYNSGEYKLDDEYEQANELYIESLNSESPIEVVELLTKAIEICPQHYDSKIDLLELNGASITEYLNVLNEYREYLSTRIDLSKVDGRLWYEVECRSYLRLLMVIGMQYLENNNPDAISFFEEALRLDKYNKVQQEVHLLSSYISFDRGEDALTYLDEFEKMPAHYWILKALAFLSLGKYSMTVKCFKRASRLNPNYLGLILGIITLEKEDVENMQTSLFHDPASLEEAYMNFVTIRDAIFHTEKYVPMLIEEQHENLIELVTANPNELEILIAMMSLEPQTINKIVELMKGEAFFEHEYCGNFSSMEKEDIKKIVLSLKRKGFIKNTESKQKYEISYYGYCALKKQIELMESMLEEE